ncbi:Sucrose phosphorylase [compost metagenome]
MAGENDEEGVRRTGEGREINRHNFSIDEIEQALGKSAVQRLLALIRFRNEYGAFNGDFCVLKSASHEVRLEWTQGDLRCTLHIDLKTNRTVIDYVDAEGMSVQYEV